ncbi:hypothetical protein PLICRDRAFT_106855 [Plicaturopsis crispa FD-325 SS-3]|nr:hypothetical protein PLICRDRAFT_106855 [Plicaturopsis crispa FD-325 SS-3]
MPVASSPTFRDIFTSLEVLSHGSLGLTRAVRRNSDGLVLARKELHYEPMTDNDRKLLASELNANRDLFHEHVVRYYDHHIGEHEGTPEILMEYFGTENLATVIKRASAEGRPIPEGTVWNYFMQILSALHYCHFPGEVNARAVKGGKDAMRTQVLHRDLKPDNVLLGDANHIKLCDFGLSKALEQVTFMSTRIGTSHYMAPELIEHKRYSTQSDIWALGCLVYEMCALKSPFAEARTQSELSAAIQSGDIPPLPAVYSPDMWAVIKSMLSVNVSLSPFQPLCVMYLFGG